MRFLYLTLLLGFTVFLSPAYAAGNNYVSLKTGIAAMSYDNVQSHDVPYVDLAMDDVYDTEFAAGIAIGRSLKEDIGYPVRIEAEYLYRSFTSWYHHGSKMHKAVQWDVDVECNAQTFFANVYYDFENDSAFTPYVGVGAGVAIIKAELDGMLRVVFPPIIQEEKGTFSDEVTNFAWNAGAGCSYAINDDWTVDLGYRFVHIGKAKLHVNGYTLDADGALHEVLLGVRYSF